jgi:phosphoribosylglycinamide formyltransferase 2
LGISGVRVFLFGKPEAYVDRRLGVVVARGRTVEEARAFAEQAAHSIETQVEIGPPASRSGRRP